MRSVEKELTDIFEPPGMSCILQARDDRTGTLNVDSKIIFETLYDVDRNLGIFDLVFPCQT